jgi:hypothetical protein
MPEFYFIITKKIQVASENVFTLTPRLCKPTQSRPLFFLGLYVMHFVPFEVSTEEL